MNGTSVNCFAIGRLRGDGSILYGSEVESKWNTTTSFASIEFIPDNEVAFFVED